MPKRNNIQRHPSTEIQGEDSYVTIRHITWGEMKSRGWLTGDKDKDGKYRVEQAEQLFAACVADWNWVDDDGNTLPLPKSNPAVVDALTSDEIAFLMERIVGSKVEITQKKSN